MTQKKGKLSVTNHIEAVLRKIEYWHQGWTPGGSKIMYRDEYCVWNQVRWDGQRASFFVLGERDEKKTREKMRSMEGG